MTISTKPIVDSISENVIFYQDRRTWRMKKQERERERGEREREREREVGGGGEVRGYGVL